MQTVFLRASVKHTLLGIMLCAGLPAMCPESRAQVLLLTQNQAIRAADIRIDSNGQITFLQPEAASAGNLTLSDLRWLHFDVRDRYVPRGPWLCLRDGRCLRGESLRIGPQRVILRGEGGVFESPLGDLAGLFFNVSRPPAGEAPVSGVRILSINGDVINAPAAELTDAGVVVDINPEADPVVLPPTRLAGVLWPAAASGNSGMLIELRTGERFRGEIARLNEHTLELKADSGIRALIRQDIRRIRSTDTRERFLDDVLAPPPALADRPTWRLNRNALGDPLRLGNRMHPRGVGLRGPAAVDTTVPTGARWFIATLGADRDAAPDVRLDIQVHIDGKPLVQILEASRVQPPQVAAVPCDGARNLKLSVNCPAEPGIGCLGDFADAMFIE